MSFYIPGSINISNKNNNVGINTLNPQYTLDVNGVVSTTNIMYTTSTGTTSYITTLNANTVNAITTNSTNSLQTNTLNSTGTISSATSLKTTNGSATFDFTEISSDGTLSTYNAGGALGIRYAFDGTERMRLTSDGNLGVGTSSPTSLLDIRSTAEFLTPFVTILSNTSSNNFGPSISIGSNTGSFNFFKIGFFTNSLGSVNNKFVIGYNATGTNFQSSIQADTSGLVYLPGYSTNGTLSLIDNNGVAQITNASDIRLKTDINPLSSTGSIEKILQLNPVTFKFKSDMNNTKVGFIAQEVEQIIPEAVDGKKYDYELIRDQLGQPILDENGNVQIDPQMKPRYRGLDTTAIIATLTKALQEQQEQINTLQRQINYLMNK